MSGWSVTFSGFQAYTCTGEVLCHFMLSSRAHDYFRDRPDEQKCTFASVTFMDGELTSAQDLDALDTMKSVEHALPEVPCVGWLLPESDSRG